MWKGIYNIRGDMVSEPTYKKIAEWLRDYANHFALIGASKAMNVALDRAAQVEAMGERRCLNCEEWLGGIHPVFGCSYDGLIHCKKLNIPGQGQDFGCIHWKRKGE